MNVVAIIPARGNSKGIKIVIPTSEESITYNLVSQPKNGKASLAGNSLFQLSSIRNYSTQYFRTIS